MRQELILMSVFLTGCFRFCLYLLLAAFYELAYGLWRFLFAAGLGFLLRTDSFMNTLSLHAQAGVWMAVVLFGLLAVYGAKHPHMTEQENFRLISVPVLGGFLGMITLSGQRLSFLSEDVMDIWVMLSLILPIGLLVLHMNRQYRMEQELARLKAGRAELLERDYQALNRSYGANARLFHDVHRHLDALHRLLEQEKYDKAMEYLDDLQEPARELAETVYTGDETAAKKYEGTLQTSCEGGRFRAVVTLFYQGVLVGEK